MSGMPRAWEDTYCCANQYVCDLAIYLMTVLSSSYSIIMDCANNAPGHGKNIFDGLNEMTKRHLEGK